MLSYISDEALKHHCKALIRQALTYSDKAQLDENLEEMYIYSGYANALADLIEMLPGLCDRFEENEFEKKGNELISLTTKGE